MAQYRDVMVNGIQRDSLHTWWLIEDGGGLLEIWWLNGDVAMNWIV